MLQEQEYIKVILPLRLEWEPFYSVPKGSKVRRGQRVEVLFSGRKYIAAVSETEADPDIDAAKVKPVSRLDTMLEDITPGEFALWRWMADYYLCTVGEVYKAAYPAAKLLREESQARAKLNKMNLREKTVSLYSERFARVRERLDAKQADLPRHKNPESKVYKSVSDAIRRLSEEYSAIQARLSALSAADTGPGDVFAAAVQAKTPGKPQFLPGPDRNGRYVEAASEELAAGRSTLILVPEIKRAESLLSKLEGRFPGELLIFHSALSAGKRMEVADILRSGAPCVVLGTHSALFLPFRSLGLVIVDDEQDPSYKRSSPAPRYNGRDTAIALAALNSADVILGSACPSLETVLNCATGKYRTLRTGAEPAYAPAEIIDAALERRKRGMAGPVSFKLLEAIERVSASGRKALLLAPAFALDELRATLNERLSDAAAGEISVANIYTSKWLEEDNLGLVAVLQSDSLLSRSDFRADERVFQLLELFRAKSPDGLFIVQTSRKDHPVFSAGEDITGLLLQERKDFSYPPFTRMVDIVCQDDNANRAAYMLRLLSESILEKKEISAVSVLGLPDRVRVIFPKDRRLAGRKSLLKSVVEGFETERNYGSFYIDVDPE